MIKINSVEIVTTNFPNKETCMEMNAEAIYSDGNNKPNTVFFKYENDADLIELMFVKKWIDTTSMEPSLLVMAHMPYARLDRVEELESVFTLKYVADLINWLSFDEVVIVEAHSDVTCALVNNARNMPLTQHLFEEGVSTGEIEFDPQDDFLCYPDATAQKRYGKMGDYKGIVGMKDRDFKTGWIKNLDIYVPNGYVVEGRNVVIVDDLCSKGGTFIMTAKELRKLGAKSITLVVAHCEENILNGDILKTDLIDKVVTSNSMISQEQTASFDKMTVADLWDLM